MQGNNWLIKQLITKYPFLEVLELKGYQTFALRNHLSLPKSKDKSERNASAHVNDAIALAASVFRKYVKNTVDKSADFVGKLKLTPFYFKCVNRLNVRPHKLHVIQPIKGNVRRSYGGSIKIVNFNNGDLVTYKTSKVNVTGYVQSNDIYNFVKGKWKRVKQLTSNKNLTKVRNTCNLILS